jgi:hypothetical protein
MLHGFVDFVILTLTDNDDARYIRSSCIMNGQPVALIDAPRIDLDGLRAFLRRRLDKARVRVAVTSDLHPFTDDALIALFAPSNRHDREPVRLPIGVAIQKLAKAMERKGKATRPAGASLGEIGEADIRAVLGV